MPKVWRTETVISGPASGAKALAREEEVVGVDMTRVPLVEGKFDRSRCLEMARLQCGIGEIDLFQPLLRGPITAMDVGMVALHQIAVAGFEFNEREGRLELEDEKRAFFLGGGALLVDGWFIVFHAEHAEIANPRGMNARHTGTQFPGRALPDRVVADLRLDLGRAHASIIIPGRVVEPDMIEAEPIEDMHRLARSRRAIIAFTTATGMIAQTHPS